MKFLVGTVVNESREQTYYIPLKKIESMVYPDANGGTLVIWTHSDGSTSYVSLRESPSRFTITSL
jgi:hypothetical protein